MENFTLLAFACAIGVNLITEVVKYYAGTINKKVSPGDLQKEIQSNKKDMEKMKEEISNKIQSVEYQLKSKLETHQEKIDKLEEGLDDTYPRETIHMMLDNTNEKIDKLERLLSSCNGDTQKLLQEILISLRSNNGHNKR